MIALSHRLTHTSLTGVKTSRVLNFDLDTAANIAPSYKQWTEDGEQGDMTTLTSAPDVRSCALMAAPELHNSPHDLSDVKLHVLQVACQQVEGDVWQLGLQAAEGGHHRRAGLHAAVESIALKG